jgi:hypothetical protein
MNMKRMFCLAFTVLICFNLAGCKSEDTDTISDIVINMPTDNTVNGYKTEEPVKEIEEKPDSVSSNSESNSTASESGEILYYANTNSKKFHKQSCRYSSMILNERLYISDNRQELIDSGYVPCLVCKP